MIITLIKLFLKENFSLKRMLGFDYKQSKIKAVFIGLAIAYAAVAFTALFGFLFFDLGKILISMGQIEVLLSFLAIYTIGLSFMIVLLRANGLLFHYKDYDILAPLPIHGRTLLISKTAVLMIMIYLSAFIFTSPIAFSYFYHAGFDPLRFLYYLIAFLCIPLIPFIFMSFASYSIARISARFRRSNLVTIIFMFAFFIWFFLFSFSFNETTVNPLTGQIEMFSGLARIYVPFTWFMKSVHEASILHLLIIVISHIGAFFLYILFLEKQLKKINQNSVNQRFHVSKKLSYQSRPILHTLVLKELRKFFSIPLYALNAGLGVVVLLILSLGSLFYQAQIQAFLGELVGFDMQIETILLIVIGFSIAMTYTPAISLSLEGKNFWIVKSLPLRASTIMFSKIVFNLLLITPVAWLSVVLLGFSFQVALINQSLLLVLVTVFSVLISVFNSVVNLYLPKLDFKNEVEVIKQSIGAFLALFGGFALLAMSGVGYYFLIQHLVLPLVLLVLIAGNAFLVLPFAYIVYSQSEKLIIKMKG